jgi:hypothetical protein
MISKAIAERYPKLKQIDESFCSKCSRPLEEDYFFMDHTLIGVKSKNCICGEPGISFKCFRMSSRINVLLSKHPKKGK